MSDDLETLRQAVEAFGRRKNDLSPAGKNALSCVTANLKVYANAREHVLETRDERVMEVVRKIIMDDIATIERELTASKGDYPGLDRRGQSVLRRLRQGSAAVGILVASIALGSMGEGALWAHAGTPIKRIEVREPVVPKAIAITDGAQHLKGLCFALQCGDLFFRQDTLPPAQREIHFVATPGPHESPTAFVPLVSDNWGEPRIGRIGQTELGNTSHVIGWGLSGIFIDDDSHRRLVHGDALGINAFDSQIGTQFALGMFFPGLPQFGGGPPKRESEESDHDRSESDYVIVSGVVINESEEAEDRFMHGGAGLIAGLIIGILFLAYNYARGNL